MGSSTGRMGIGDDLPCCFYLGRRTNVLLDPRMLVGTITCPLVVCQWVVLGGQARSVSVCIQRLQGVKHKRESTGRRNMECTKSFHKTGLCFVEDSVGAS